MFEILYAIIAAIYNEIIDKYRTRACRCVVSFIIKGSFIITVLSKQLSVVI